MKIIIVGNGKTGYHLAGQLSLENHDITVVDKFPAQLRSSQNNQDVITYTGDAVNADVLREAGAEVLGIVSIFTYGMQKGLDRLAAANVENTSLTNFDVIAEVAAQEGYIQPEDIAKLIKFRNNPSDESWIGGNE